MIIAGDIGGTKCTITVFAESGTALRPVFRFSAATRECASVSDLLERFKAQAEKKGCALAGDLTAAFGVAGALDHDRMASINLPWPVERSALAHGLNLDPARTLLMNDLVASATSLAFLAESDLVVLNPGTAEPHAPKALIAVGTGLGEAILFWDGHGYRVFPAEGSLTEFAPRNDREILLLQGMRRRLPRVCCEDVVSGRGFRAIHQVLFPEAHHEWLEESDAAARITQQAMEGSCPACVETLQIWMEAYGSEAGNMALRSLSYGGVYIAGGIALKILPKLQEGAFLRAFTDKGTLSGQLARIPIYIVRNEDAVVLGAAHAALQHQRR
ncbi:MAG TPA: glucokinase [Terriglobales bacterium]|nr:glucokinase [Terriglobales bacterium]